MHPRFKKLPLALGVFLPTILSAYYPASSNAQSSASSLVQTPPMGWSSYNYFGYRTSDSILTNRDVIAIDQDPRGEQGTPAYAEGEVEIWTRHLANEGLAICIINNGTDRYSSNPFHIKSPGDLIWGVTVQYSVIRKGSIHGGFTHARCLLRVTERH
jgi:hypothetical protein